MKSGFLGKFLRIAVSLGAIGFVVYMLRGKFGESLHILHKHLEWSWFFLACVCYLAGLALLGLRLQTMFRAHKILFPFFECFYLTFVALFFNFFFPSAVGGDVAKIYFAVKRSGKKLEATTSIILDRLMGFVALIVMALVAVLFFGREIADARIHKIVYIFFGIMFFMLIFFANKKVAGFFALTGKLLPHKIRERLKEFYGHAHHYRHYPEILVKAFSVSLIGQVFFILIYFCIAMSIGAHLNLGLFFILVPVVSIISMVPSIGGLGVREAGVVYVFQHFMSSEQAFAISILADIVIYGFGLIAGLVFAMRGGLKSKDMKEMEALQS